MGAWEWIDADLHDVLPNLTSNGITYTLTLSRPSPLKEQTTAPVIYVLTELMTKNGGYVVTS